MAANLSRSQRQMLRSIKDYGDPRFGLQGRSAAGGSVLTLRSLRNLGYVEEKWTETTSCRQASYLITAAGDAALART